MRIYLCVKLSSNIRLRLALEATRCTGCRISKQVKRFGCAELHKGFVFRSIRIKFDAGYVEQRQSLLLKAPEAWRWSLPSSTNKDLCTQSGCRIYSWARRPSLLLEFFRMTGAWRKMYKQKYTSMYYVRQTRNLSKIPFFLSHSNYFCFRNQISYSI